MQIFTQDIIQKRRQNLATNWSEHLREDDAVLIACGEPIKKPGGLDQTYYFLPHPAYFWLTGVQRASGVVFYSKKAGWVDFINPITAAEKIWEGAISASAPQGKDLAELNNFLTSQKLKNIYSLGQTSPELSNLSTDRDTTVQTRLSLALDATRRIKDQAEVDLIVEAARIANKGYERIKQFIQPGVSEKEIQIEYEAEVQRHGAHKMPYDTIVGSGVNAAILHAIPTSKKIKKDELILVDAGVDLFDYCVDITRVYPASGTFSSRQQEIYSIVLESQKRAMAMAVPNTEWSAIHRESARVITDGLKQLKILEGDVDSILESGAISVFYPHGVGHLVGLRVRDTGCLENTKPQKYCGVTLRVDMKIKENYILTIEPGCYFIESLINNTEIRTRYSKIINWSEVEKWKDFGGVRIEDDILVTKSTALNLTEIVKK
jgi:Xaa-Pro dipeptidase